MDKFIHASQFMRTIKPKPAAKSVPDKDADFWAAPVGNALGAPVSLDPLGVPVFVGEPVFVGVDVPDAATEVLLEP